jgi:hypothetical protein
MYCPVCESEYEEGIKRCPDDNADLVERLSEETARDRSDARFVALHNVGSPAEAEMVHDILRQNGIRSAVQSGGMDALSPLLSTGAPGALVLVDERDYERAMEIYNSFFGQDTSPLTGTTFEEDAEAAGGDDDTTDDGGRDDGR